MIRMLLAMFAVLCFASLSAAAGTLSSFSSRYYEIFSDLPRADVTPIARHMDSVYDEYTRRFQDFKSKDSSRFKLYIFRTEPGYQAFLRDKGVAARNTGGVFFLRNGDSGLATYVHGQDGLRMFHVLQHEGFHQFAYARIGQSLPIWANEGLAEYFGNAILFKGTMKTGVTPENRLVALQMAIKAGVSIPFDTMMSMTSEKWIETVDKGSSRAGLQYDQAWSMAHFLIQGDGGKYAEAFGNYLRSVSTGMQHRQAFEKAFDSADTAPFEREWKKYIMEKVEPDAISTAIVRLEFLGEGIKTLDKHGVKVSSLEELKKKLIQGKFELTRVEDGVKRVFKATDVENFDPPPGDDPSRPVTIELVPASGGAGGAGSGKASALPGVRVKGLTVGVKLSWVRSEDGVDSRIDFE